MDPTKGGAFKLKLTTKKELNSYIMPFRFLSADGTHKRPNILSLSSKFGKSDLKN